MTRIHSAHSRIETLNGKIERLSLRLASLQQTRLILGLSVFGLLIASQIAKGMFIEFAALFLVLPVFIFYFKKSRALQDFIKQLENLKSFYKKQIQFKEASYTDFARPEDMCDINLARDLDLGVLFSGMNYCFTQEGEDKLNQWLCQSFGDSTLNKRQENIKKLLPHSSLIRRLHIVESEEKIQLQRVEKEISRSFFDEGITWKWLVPGAWVAFIALATLGLPSIFWKIALFTYVGSMLFYLNRTQSLFSRLQDLHTDFSQLGERIHYLEKIADQVDFTPELSKQKASKDIASLASLIALMSVKTNPILFYILNLIAPWDFFLAEVSERARRKFYGNFKNWSQEIVEIEVLSCLCNLWTYQDTHWAQTSDAHYLEAKNVSHPLLNQGTVVKNDFSSNDQQVFIVTGSNMSGKSTFLRAIGINFCLANIGAPVFAESFSFKPMPIETCIRVSDSLRDGQSYFYAEVQRMKRILLEAKKGQLLFLIDEPLRGTNNRERLVGNQSYLQEIIACGAYGFISTHDLELTQLADGKEAIANCHFSDRWENEQLVFDYKIKEGPSQTTNALKILAQEGLYDPKLL